MVLSTARSTTTPMMTVRLLPRHPDRSGSRLERRPLNLDSTASASASAFLRGVPPCIVVEEIEEVEVVEV